MGGAMKPFVVNGHGRLVFPSNFSADLDFSGSIDAIIPVARLRPDLIEALERGIAHMLEPSLQEADRGCPALE